MSEQAAAAAREEEEDEGASSARSSEGGGAKLVVLPPLPPSSSDLPPVPSLRPCSLADFDVLRRLGGGSFSDVLSVRPLRTWPGLWEGEEGENGGKIALKVVDKHLLLRSASSGGGASAATAERATLAALRGQYGINRLLFTFQDESSLFFGLELVPGGELFDQVQAAKEKKRREERKKSREERKKTKESEKDDGENDDDDEDDEEEEKEETFFPVLPFDAVRAYAAQLVLVLRSLRSKKVAHRDFKPENLLLDAGGRLRLVDFGCAAWFDDDDDDGDGDGEGEEEEEEEEGSEGSDDDEEDLPATAEEAAARALRRHSRRARQQQQQQQQNQHPLSRARRGGAAADFVGTADYLPPEALGCCCSESSGEDPPAEKQKRKKLARAALRAGACPARDLWALGCVVFQLLVGEPPFRAASEYLTYQRISAFAASASAGEEGEVVGEEEGGLRWPPSKSESESESEVAKRAAAVDLVRRLLDPNPLTRLGARSLDELAAHAFFEGTDWAAVAERGEEWVPEPLEVNPPRASSSSSSPSPSSSPAAAAAEAAEKVDDDRPGKADELGLDWELLSIAAAGAPPLRYEHEGAGGGDGGDGGGVVLGGGVHALSPSSFAGGGGGGGGQEN